MRYITTILCTLAFLVAGISLAIQDKNDSPVFKHQTISAATVPNGYSLPELPLDLQLDLEKKYKTTDTVYVTQPSDTVFVEKVKWVKSKHNAEHTTARAALKRQGLDIPASEPDSIIKNKVCGDREEYTPDTIGPPKGSICLIVDGEVVYKR
jgi:hypothetical protein